MWRLHVLGLRADLWSHVLNQAGVRVLRNVLSGTLDTLVQHYSSIRVTLEESPTTIQVGVASVLCIDGIIVFKVLTPKTCIVLMYMYLRVYTLSLTFL